MKNFIKIFFAVVPASFIFTACGDMDSIHSKYSDRPEVVYLGRVDSLRAHGGLNRIMLSWYMNADPKIERTVVYWNFGLDSLVKPFVRTTPGFQKDSVFIEGLDEGNYNFEVYNRNSHGLNSLSRSVSGYSYGDAFQDARRRRSISSMVLTPDETAQSNEITITWGDADATNVYSEIIYTKKSTGEKTTVFVTSEKDKTNKALVTTFDDVANALGDEDSMFDIVCYYVPAKGACDTIPKTFPDQMMTYLSTGSRIQYTAAGVGAAPISWSNYGKTLRYVKEGVYDCNFIGGWGTNAVNLFRLTINEDNTVDMVGYYANYSWTLSNTAGTTSTYDPDTKTFTVKYKVITDAAGAYTEVQEVISPRY